jgi:hypothetical protein
VHGELHGHLAEGIGADLPRLDGILAKLVEVHHLQIDLARRLRQALL